MSALRNRLGALLGAAERYTRTDIRYLLSGGFWLTVDQVAGSLAAFLLIVAFAHFVPKETYGTYRFLIAALWTLTALTMTGLPTVISQAVARGNEGVYRKSFRTSIIWGWPLAAAALVAAAYYAFATDYHLAIGFLIIAVLGPLFQAGYLFGSYLIGRKAFRTIAVYGTLFAVFPAIALLVTMAFTHDPLVFLGVYLGSTIVTGGVLAYSTFARYRPNHLIEPGYEKLGGHFSAMNFLSTLAAQADKLIVFHYLGAVDLAVYAFATALPEQAKNVFNSVTTLALPKFTERPIAAIRGNLWYRVLLFTCGLVVVVAIYYFVAPYLYTWFFPTYPEAIRYSQLYAITLITVGGSLPITLLQAKGAKRELYLFNVLSPVFQIAILIMLTAWYGLIGTIAARIIGRAVSFLIGGVLLEVFARRSRLGEQ